MWGYLPAISDQPLGTGEVAGGFQFFVSSFRWETYLVGGLEHQFYFPIYWVANHPNWLSYFSEGWPNHQPACVRGLRMVETTSQMVPEIWSFWVWWFWAGASRPSRSQIGRLETHLEPQPKNGHACFSMVVQSPCRTNGRWGKRIKHRFWFLRLPAVDVQKKHAF